METLKSVTASDQTLKSVRPLPLPVARAISKLGQDINRGRRLRQLTQQSLAERAGVSLATIKRLEAGDPRMQLHVLARVLQVFGDVAKLAALLDAGSDELGLALMAEQLPQRIRPRKNPQRAF